MAQVLTHRPSHVARVLEGLQVLGIWNARYGGGCLARITPRGEVDRLIELPVSQPTSYAFGDPDLRTLYVTSARQRLSEPQLRSEPLAGALFAVRLDVGGLPEPECAL